MATTSFFVKVQRINITNQVQVLIMQDSSDDRTIRRNFDGIKIGKEPKVDLSDGWLASMLIPYDDEARHIASLKGD